ncbi:hypothetical protein HMPREF0063_12236 [Aeromicrobium marinum DSM 15272]|uniref:Uncharacterized protein n=1 Tax=Aeromicrobium marinum DSM 15272 TaxID=585531 RepID=E2SCS4_9ACTN|nr:hypothetical protein [Aeromicrobium marinum]EFQ83027.1 hypothetical protein HMPREF0063_12236 [Aeromicrobium marinum DSM 15272]
MKKFAAAFALVLVPVLGTTPAASAAPSEPSTSTVKIGKAAGPAGGSFVVARAIDWH